MTGGEAAAGLALALRIPAMSGWVMQVVRGIFENVGVIQESMETVARPHALVDAPGARPLACRAAASASRTSSFHYGREEGVLERLDLRHRAGREGRVSSARAAPANRRSCRCSCACTTSKAGAS